MRSALFAIVLFFSASATAQHTRYFRHVDYDDNYRYKFKVEVSPVDTATANCYRVQYRKDGLPMRWDYLSARRLSVDPKFRVASVLIEYDGIHEAHTYFDAHKNPMASMNGEYSERLDIVRDSVWRRRVLYGRSGKLLRIRSWKSLSTSLDSCNTFKWRVDGNGRRIQQFCYNRNEHEIEDYITEIRYDYYSQDGATHAISYFSPDDTLTPIKRTVNIYNKVGSLIKLIEYDKDKIWTGSWSILFGYDTLGYETMGQSYDESDMVSFSVEREYDHRGNITLYRYHDYTYYSRVEHRYKYDEHNNEIEESTFDSLGTLLHVKRSQYNTLGNLIETRFFDSKNNLTHDKEQGYCIARHEYDINGNHVKTSYFDIQNRPVADRRGVAIQAMTYNEWGQVQTLTYLDSKNRLVRPNFPDAAVLIYEYSPDGDLLKTKYLDEKGGLLYATPWDD